MINDPISLPQPSFTVSKRADIAPEAPLYGLVRRRLPQAYHDAFTFTLRPGMAPVSGSTSNIYDAYKVTSAQSSSADGSNSDKVVIEAASLSGLGVGLNHYLKQVCQVEMTWSGDRFDTLPSTPPPLPAEGLSGSSFVPWRYYMNVVTFGYTYAFWDWSRWERELDWMMLNGVNMALGMVGQEHVFRQFYLNLGLTDEEIDSFLGGPAFTPWQRMGNLQGSWGYNQSATEVQFKKRWYETQWALQQQIIGRMREFNMTAVLPSFNGFVPQAMKTKYPDTAYEQSSLWAGMPAKHTHVTYIPSTEPMFSTLSQQFIQLQTSMYNGYTSHYYLLDLYNELEPPCETLQCFTDVTSNVMKALKSADPQAIWVMQGWFLVNRGYWNAHITKAFFDGIKKYNNGQDAFVFDLYSDVVPLWKDTEGYYGIEWGWSMLNNFGGGQGLYGTLPTLLTEPFAGFNHAAKSMRGMGITMEGINNNEFLYQLIFDLPWHRADLQSITPVKGSELLHDYIRRRYGPNQTTPAMQEAWQKLSQTVWDCRTGQMSQSKTFLDITPSLQMEHPGFMTTKMWYDRKIVVDAWEQLIGATETEASRKRRGAGPILGSIEQLLKSVASGEPSSNKAQTFSSKIRQSIKETLSVIMNRPSSVQTVVPNVAMDPSLLSSSPAAANAVEDTPASPLLQRADTPSPLPSEDQLPLKVSSFRYDIVDVTREVLLGTVLPALQKELVIAYTTKNQDRVRFLGEAILGVIDDTDRILNTHSNFMLGTWLMDARARASDVDMTSSSPNNPHALPPLTENDKLAYEDYLEYNARNQITWWGPAGQMTLADYASKHWGGQVKTYYWPRWKIFIDHLQRATRRGEPPFDPAAYRRDSLAHETLWQTQTIAPMNNGGSGLSKIPTEEQGDTIEVSQEIWDRWSLLAKRIAKGDRV